MKREFPAHFPKDCPPAEAQPFEQECFRLVRNDPPQHDDFKSHVERGMRTGDDRCKASGVSVFTRIIDIEKVRRTVPGLRKHVVARGKADPGDGVALPTPAPTRINDSHHTWWLFDGVSVAGKFGVIETKPKGKNDVASDQ